MAVRRKGDRLESEKRRQSVTPATRKRVVYSEIGTKRKRRLGIGARADFRRDVIQRCSALPLGILTSEKKEGDRGKWGGKERREKTSDCSKLFGLDHTSEKVKDNVFRTRKKTPPRLSSERSAVPLTS